MDFKKWIKAERGRLATAAKHFGVTPSAINQWGDGRVPLRRMRAVRDFTDGAVAFEDMVPGRPASKAKAASAATRGSSKRAKA